jgi:hypothetical protein
MQSIVFLIFLPHLVLLMIFVVWIQARTDAAYWRQANLLSAQRCQTTVNIVMEMYKRLYHEDDYVHKRETLVNLLDLLNVHGVGSCVDALQNPQGKPADDESPAS